MKKVLAILSVIVLFLSFNACSGKKDSAASIARKWCELSTRLQNAPDGGPEYGNAKAARDKYQQEMEAKYEKDEAFMKEVKKEAEKCESEYEWI